MKFDPTRFYRDPDDLWRGVGGVYECPKSPDGKRLGPLVGYAGTYYDDLNIERHFVGESYYDFAMVEQYPQALDRFATILKLQLVQDDPTVLLAAPLGGLWLTSAVGRVMDVRQVFAEKKVITPGSDGQREVSQYILGRHRLFPGDRVGIIEDVCNNFSTTIQLIMLALAAQAQVVSIGCALNRSPRTTYTLSANMDAIPVRSVIHREIPEFRHDDHFVASDVLAGKVAWKPKLQWEELTAAMQAAPEGKHHGYKQERPPSP